MLILNRDNTEPAPMLHYFYLLKRDWLETTLRPALAASWRRRNFAPCLAFCRELIATKPIPDDAVLRRVIDGLGFDRTLWHALIGECLVLAAADLPRIPCMIDALRCLLTPERRRVEATDRGAFTAIEQIYYGTRDLRFAGGWYRPEHVGWNDSEDIARLTEYLRSIDPACWSADALAPLPDLADDPERAEELAYVRDWWPALVEMYEAAWAAQQVIVCERS